MKPVTTGIGAWRFRRSGPRVRRASRFVAAKSTTAFVN